MTPFPTLLALLLAWTLAEPQASPSPPVYEAGRARPAPVLDGDLSDPAWANAPWTREFVDIRGPDWPAPTYRTRIKILWDERYLYVAADLEEPHLWGTLTRRDAIIYQDDDLEVFLDPGGEGREYFELEINALGTVFDLFLDKPYREGGRAEVSWDPPGLLAGILLRGTLNDPSDQDVGWTVELGIPWADLVPPPHTPPRSQEALPPDRTTRGRSPAPGPPDPGDEWRVNFSRVDWPLVALRNPETGQGVYRKDVGRNPDPPHPEANWVWSPQGEVNMHIPDRWGVLRFVDTPPEGFVP